MRWMWFVVAAGCSGATPRGSSSGAEASDGTIVDPLPAGAPGRIEGRLQIEPASQCGGAMPAPDFVPPPMAPAPERALEVSVGDVYRGHKPALVVTTDADGRFEGTLPAGRYCVTLQGRGPRPANVGSNYDLPCLVAQWERCDAVVEVPVTAPIEIEIHEPCAGLSCYHGPPPP